MTECFCFPIRCRWLQINNLTCSFWNWIRFYNSWINWLETLWCDYTLSLLKAWSIPSQRQKLSMAKFSRHSPALISRVFWRNGHYLSFAVLAHLDLVREIEFCFVLASTNSGLIINPLTIIVFIHDCWEIGRLFITIWESCQRCTIDQKFWLIAHWKHLASILPSCCTPILFSSLNCSWRDVLDRY